MKDEQYQKMIEGKTNVVVKNRDSHLAEADAAFALDLPKITSVYVESTKITKDTCIEIYVHARDILHGSIHWMYSFTGSNGFFYESQEPEARVWIKVMLEPQELGFQEGDEITFSVSVCNIKGDKDTHTLKFTIIESAKEESLK